MGHYYAEMACSKCGHLLCRCPPKKVVAKKQWVIDKTTWTAKPYVVPPYVTALNFSEVTAAKYDTREEAESAIPMLIAQQRDELLAEADILDMMLTLVPGKTNICPKCFEPPTSCFCGGGYR